MADLDRIIALKVALDTGELAAGLDKTGSKLGTLGTQIGGFVKATGIGLALQGIDLIVGKVGEGVERSQELEKQTANLGLALDRIGSDRSVADVLGEVSEKARNLGFDETEAVLALNTILNTAGDLDEAMVGLDAAMDLTRANPDEVADLADAGTRLRDVFAGDFTASVDDFGASLEALKAGDIAEGFANIAGSAEEFAGTTAGMGAVLDETVTQAFAELGDVINELARVVLPILINDVLPALHDLWVELQPAIDDVWEAIQALIELIQTLEPIWRPILETLWEIFKATLGALPEVIEEINDAIKSIQSAIQQLIGFLQRAEARVRKAVQDVADAILGPLQEVQSFVQGFDPLGAVGGFIGDINPFGGDSSGGSSSRSSVQVNVRGDARIVETAVLSAMRRAGRNGGFASARITS